LYINETTSVDIWTYNTTQERYIHYRHTATTSQLLSLFLQTKLSALTQLVGWLEGHLACKKSKWWGAGMVICLGWGADLHMAQLMPLPLTISCSS